MEDIITLLGNGFFPIVMCGILVWYVYKMNESHKDEIDKLREALENNTKVMTKICAKLDIDEEE